MTRAQPAKARSHLPAHSTAASPASQSGLTTVCSKFWARHSTSFSRKQLKA